MTEWKWSKDDPLGAGYYLATWRYGRAGFRVSELWYDGHSWWTGRSYIRQEDEDVEMDLGFCITERVIAWADKPKPFKGDNHNVEIYTVR